MEHCRVTIRVLIVDDEPVARRGILRLLRQEPDIEVVDECGDGISAVAAIIAHSPDLVFLDVQMPELEGFAVIEAVGANRMPAVVFVTAFDQHAVRAFDAQAIDYLLKPVDPERFRRALQRARARLAHPDDGFVRRRKPRGWPPIVHAQVAGRDADGGRVVFANLHSAFTRIFMVAVRRQVPVPKV